MGAEAEGYGSELFNQLSKVLSEIVEQGSAALGDTKQDTLFNLRQVFAILEATDKAEYEEIKRRVNEKDSIYGESPQDLAAKIESETARARKFGIYIDILPKEEEQPADEQAKSAASLGYGNRSSTEGEPADEPAPAPSTATATGGTLVRVTPKNGGGYDAVIVEEQ